MYISYSNDIKEDPSLSRRNLLSKAAIASTGGAALLLLQPSLPANAAPASSSVSDLLSLLKEADAQMDKIPALIESEKWDSVRALLISQPLSDCREKGASNPILPKYADAVGDAGGDELSVLEAKEELQSHLRYLDMAVYNNNFNPITVEGKNGATKELIRSYYEDPLNEYKASRKALQELIQVGKEL
ncbi:MAG: hypothetical protein SGARI_007232 [Bacillariaceae sp.]